jgi:hypothetical protein
MDSDGGVGAHDAAQLIRVSVMSKRVLKNQKGAALLIIAGIMVTLSIIFDTVLIGFDSNIRSMEAFGAKKQAFYMSEGTRALVTVLLENFLMNNSDPTPAEISDWLPFPLFSIRF